MKAELKHVRDQFDEFTFDQEFRSPLQFNMGSKLLLNYLCHYINILKELRDQTLIEKLAGVFGAPVP